MFENAAETEQRWRPYLFAASSTISRKRPNVTSDDIVTLLQPFYVMAALARRKQSVTTAYTPTCPATPHGTQERQAGRY
ncbi:hypothetical protein E2C01_094854 [Portunus trituberculatus]|uniref:Uncharacterized protein n=1 Tax=Portunus trituberculatus TaxID=210409 RepID=A0A5B7JNA3_PORTR|nr:hypothetical protein [Portunus trituberculatus]